MTSSSIIKRIDKGLGQLYLKQNRKDYYPNGPSKPGLFSLWCAEQGFDDTDVEEETQNPADSCLLVDYCIADDFPFSFEIRGEDEEDTQLLKQKQIYQIIKLLCIISVTKGKQIRDPNHKYTHPNQINLYFQQKDYKKCVEIYTKHVYYTLGYHGIHEQSLMNLLTVSTANNGFPFLRYMVDSFQRDRVKAVYEGTNNALSLNAWFHSNTFCKNLSKRDPSKAAQLKQAILSYCNRIAPNFQFAPEVKINDSIKLIAQYLVGATKFISKIISECESESESVLPFQCDIIFKFHSVVGNIGTVQLMENDENTEIESEESDPNRYTFDYVGNVNNKIVKEKLAHFLNSIPQQLNAGNDSEFSGEEIVSQYLTRSYRNFQRRVSERGKYKNIIINEQTEAKMEKETYQWPNRHRFCAFIDRTEDEKDLKNENVIIYEPPNDAKMFPHSSEFVSEWHFENLRKCIIPRVGYGNGGNERSNLEEIRNLNDRERSKRATITSAEGCHGQIGTFSFHVTQRDEICCYFFWEGRVLRFYPQDILEVFPFIFVDKWGKHGRSAQKSVYNNKVFIASVEGKELARSMIIQDFQFESWYSDLCDIDDFPKYSN